VDRDRSNHCASADCRDGAASASLPVRKEDRSAIAAAQKHEPVEIESGLDVELYFPAVSVSIDLGGRSRAQPALRGRGSGSAGQEDGSQTAEEAKFAPHSAFILDRRKNRVNARVTSTSPLRQR
jgi:hypothetical protein